MYYANGSLSKSLHLFHTLPIPLSLRLKNNCLLYCFIIIYEAPIAFSLLPLNDTFTRLTGTTKKMEWEDDFKQPPNTFTIFIAFHPFYIKSVAKTERGWGKRKG